ncbi:MAG: PspA/IM30 family protein [Aggregatilineales bacterium]
MDDFFKKLNVLVRASVNDLLGDEREGGRRSRALRLDALGKDVDREIAALRARINQALDYEDKLQARVSDLQAQAARWDEQVDALILRGDDDAARRAAEQLQLVRQRVSMAESDLREHQLVTQELILRVNELEAAVADTRQRESGAPNRPIEPAAQSTGRLVADVLRDVREKVADMRELVSGSAVAPPRAGEQAASGTADSQEVEDDLARRRDRLSKK